MCFGLDTRGGWTTPTRPPPATAARRVSLPPGLLSFTLRVTPPPTSSSVCTCSIPQIILNDVFKPPTDELGMTAYIGAFNTIFLYVTICVAYGMVG